MIHLLKYLDGAWEQARGYLREDLDHLESALNQRWAATFGDENQLQSGVISGDPSTGVKYVSNTGPNHTPKWDQVDLAHGVKSRLPFPHFVAASAPARLVGRGDGTAGDFQELTLGDGLAMSGTELRAVVDPIEDVMSAGFWSPISNGDPVSPELIFTSDTGDCIVGFTPTP